jgi:hypothetical protein
MQTDLIYLLVVIADNACWEDQNSQSCSVYQEEEEEEEEEEEIPDIKLLTDVVLKLIRYMKINYKNWFCSPQDL